MSLTVEQAAQAGQLAAAAIGLRAAIANLQGAIAAAATITAIEVNTSLGPMNAPIPLAPADSLTLLNATLAIYQAMLASIVAQLQAM